MKVKMNIFWSIHIGLIGLLSMSSVVFAQVQNNGNIYIADSGQMHIASGSFEFGPVAGQTLTSRAINYGVISFASNASWNGASNDRYLDGYTRYYGNSAFIAPVGQSAIYAPVKIIPSSTSGVDVAYFRSNPSSIGSSLASNVASRSTVEYWVIKGEGAAKISLTWRASSGIESMLLTPSLTYLTILGFNGSAWVEIPSFFDTISFTSVNSSVSEGSISSTDAVTLSNYTAFTLGVKNTATCFPLVSSSSNTKTWNGSTWSPSEPTLSDPVVLNAPFNGSLSAYSIQLNADCTLADGQTLDIVDGFSGAGKIIMSSEASLLQRNSLGVPPVINITKITNPMRRFDYVFLSSPINNFASFYSDLNNPSNVAVNGQFNTLPASAFYNFFTDNDAGASVTVTSNNVAIGRGFAAAVSPVQAPYSTISSAGAWFNEKYPIHIKTQGQTNNGDINLPLPASTGWVRVGNPYPSPINAIKLLDALGDNVRKTVYYWSFNSPRQNWTSNSANYNSADYATFNYSGGVAACNGCQVPTGVIATMQSVYIRKLNPSPMSFSLTNCLRDLHGNDTFFRNESPGKYSINFIGSVNSFSQLMVAYNGATTIGYDNGFDSPRMGGAITSELNSLIDGNTTGYAIQTRASFNLEDRVGLQLAKRTDESFTVNLVSKEGVFEDGNLKIIFHDRLLGIYHDLASGPYTFIQEGLSTDNDRFEIVYQDNVLSLSEFNNHKVLAFIKDSHFMASASKNIDSVEIFDIAGRHITSYSNLNKTIVETIFDFPEAVYLAKVKLESGEITTHKLINIKIK